MKFGDIEKILGAEAKGLLGHSCKTIDKARLHLPGPDFVDRVWRDSDRSISVLRNLQTTLNHGRLGGTGYLSILPVDQGIQHSAGASFAPNPDYFDPENIVKLGLEGGCNAVTSTLGVLGAVARKYAHRIPFVLKINHNELLTYPNLADQKLFAGRQIEEISRSFAMAHELGMYTILWCYLRNPAFKTKEKDFHLSADLSSQANHLGSTIQADIIKQKLPENNGGYNALKLAGSDYGKTDPRIYSELTSDHPIDLCRYQVLNCFAGRAGLINSGGASGKNDIAEAVKTAVINKRAGGMGLISGRKAFQKPLKEGVEILNAIQDVYLAKEVTIA